METSSSQPHIPPIPAIMEELQAKHRKEQRDLQSRITQKKKAATKKTRKGVNDECAALERELKERQEREIAELLGQGSTADADGADVSVDDLEPAPLSDEHAADATTKSLASLSVSDAAPEVSGAPAKSAGRKPNRQKARLARRAAEQEALAAQAAEEAANLPDQREQERTKMLELFKKYGLEEKEIRADGHCLYSAVADQLDTRGLRLTPKIELHVVPSEGAGDAPGYKTTRHMAAEFIKSNPDDFEPFLEEPLEQYLHKIRDTGEWGGHLELQALAKAYKVKINVLHADGRIDKIEPDSNSGDDVETIWLGYYRHGFGLGEHYNSLRKAP